MIKIRSGQDQARINEPQQIAEDIVVGRPGRIPYWFGHSSITTTEVYAHLIPEAIRYESARVFPEQAAVESSGLLLGDNGEGR